MRTTAFSAFPCVDLFILPARHFPDPSLPSESPGWGCIFFLETYRLIVRYRLGKQCKDTCDQCHQSPRYVAGWGGSGDTAKTEADWKEKDILHHETTWMDLEDMMLSDMDQSQEDKYCMSPLTWGTWNSEIYMESKYGMVVVRHWGRWLRELLLFGHDFS